MRSIQMRRSYGRTCSSSLTARLFLLLGAGLLPATSAQAENEHLPVPIYAHVAQALVRIEADGCPAVERAGPRRVSQGFVHNTPGQVVTVLHGIAGCDTINVWLYGGKNQVALAHSSPARMVKFLPEADLALLELHKMPPPDAGWPRPLLIGQPPSPNTDVFAVARWRDAVSPRDKKLRIAHGSQQLGHIVDGPARDELEQRQSPSLELEIVNIDGTIISGSSGAPIIDASGQLVAIADGGLGEGTAQINWAIPAREIDVLFASAETSVEPRSLQYGGSADSLFSAEFEILAAEPTPSVRCGDRELLRMRTVGIEELMMAADDPLGGLELLASMQMDHSQAQFDVYQDYDSGAAIAVPAGVSLVSFDVPGLLPALRERGVSGGFCLAQVKGHPIQLSLGIFETAISGPEDLERSLDMYHWAATQGQPMEVAFEYPVLLTRADGFYTQRAALVRDEEALQDIDVMSEGSGAPINAIFTTMAARDSTIVFYSAVSVDGDQLAQLEEVIACLEHPSVEFCGDLAAQTSLWEEFLLAVHLTTFPP